MIMTLSRKSLFAKSGPGLGYWPLHCNGFSRSAGFVRRRARCEWGSGLGWWVQISSRWPRHFRTESTDVVEG